jgi:transcriptional regulator with XRE-family HTH domain
VNYERLGRTCRVLRVRQRLNQSALAAAAHQSRTAVSLLERGLGARLRLSTVEAIVAAVGARMELRVMWNGPELDRMLDAAHAAVQASVKVALERWGWAPRVEVSYSRFGERGRIDLLAWHPPGRILLVIEVKTELVDVQALLGSTDAKTRLARHVAEQFGWEVRHVVPGIVFAEDRTVRDRLRTVDVLFDRFALRGRAATAWLRRPSGTPTGLLWFTTVPGAAKAKVGRRVYRRRAAA